MMPRGPSSSSTSKSGGRSHGGPPWGRPSASSASSGATATTATGSIPVVRSMSGSSVKSASSAVLARKRSRMEKFGSPPPFNPSPGPSGADTTPEGRPVSSHHHVAHHESDADLMSARPVTAQGSMSSASSAPHRQHMPSSYSYSTATSRDSDAFCPTAVHVSQSRPSTTSGSAASSSASKPTFHPHNHHQTMSRPWAAASSSTSAAPSPSVHDQPNVMHVSPLSHMDLDMTDELDEDVIMMSVDPELLNSGAAASSSGDPATTHHFAMPMTPRHQQQQHHPLTPPASSSIVSRAPPRSYASTYSLTHQHEPRYSPSTTPAHTDPHLHPPPPPMTRPDGPIQPMTLDQIEAMLQAQLNELTSAFSDVRDVLAQSQWCISKHKQHVRDATERARREKERLASAIQGKLVESQALIADPLGVGTAARSRREETLEGQQQQMQQEHMGVTAGRDRASGSPPPQRIEGPGEGARAGGTAQGAGYRDYVEPLELEEMLRSRSTSPANGDGGGSPARTGAVAAANADGMSL